MFVVLFQSLPQPSCVIAHARRLVCWAEARVKIARMTLTIKLDGNWSSFQLANSAPPLSVTDSAIAPSARIAIHHLIKMMPSFAYVPCSLCECRRIVVLFRNTLPGSRDLLPLRVCCRRLCAMPVQHARAPEQARGDTSPQKNKCDKQVPVETYQLSH